MTRWMRQGTPRGAGLPGCRFFCWRENWAKLMTNSIISAMSVGMHSCIVSLSAARVVVIMAGLGKRAIDSSTGVRRERGRIDRDRKRCSVSVGRCLLGRQVLEPILAPRPGPGVNIACCCLLGPMDWWKYWSELLDWVGRVRRVPGALDGTEKTNRLLVCWSGA